MRYTGLLILVLALTASGCRAAEGAPEQQVVALVKQLQSEKIGTAFQDLFSGSLTGSRKPTEVRMMDSQARTAWDLFGPPMSYEIVERQAIGQKLFRIKWITWHKDDIPMFWNGTFLKRGEKWEAFGIFFFDDPIKAGL